MPPSNCIYCKVPCTDNDSVTCCDCKGACAHCDCVKSRTPLSKASVRKWKCENCAARVGSPLSTEPPKFELAAIMAELKEIRDEARKNHDSLVEKLDKQTERIEKMESEQSEMKNKIALQDAAIARLNQQVDDMMQEKLANNVELHGMPENDGENLHEVVEKVANLLDAPDTGNENAIAAVYRGRQLKNGPRPIIISFQSHDDKVTWMKSRKTKAFRDHKVPVQFSEKASQHSAASGGRGTSQQSARTRSLQIYEQLTPGRRQLLFAARKASFENNFKFVWTKNGKVLVRKNENSRAIIRINNQDDITTKIVVGEKESNSNNPSQYQT